MRELCKFLTSFAVDPVHSVALNGQFLHIFGGYTWEMGRFWMLRIAILGVTKSTGFAMQLFLTDALGVAKKGCFLSFAPYTGWEGAFFGCRMGRCERYENHLVRTYL